MKNNGFLQDAIGDKSSKRLWGSVLIGLGAMLGFGSSVYGLFYPIHASGHILKVVEVFLATGGVLELGGIADQWKARKMI